MDGLPRQTWSSNEIALLLHWNDKCHHQTMAIYRRSLRITGGSKLRLRDKQVTQQLTFGFTRVSVHLSEFECMVPRTGQETLKALNEQCKKKSSFSCEWNVNEAKGKITNRGLYSHPITGWSSPSDLESHSTTMSLNCLICKMAIITCIYRTHYSCWATCQGCHIIYLLFYPHNKLRKQVLKLLSFLSISLSLFFF